MSGFGALPAHEIALAVDGRAYLGWTEIAIDRGIDTLVGSFDLALTAKERTGAADWPLLAGRACEIRLATGSGSGETLITGWIDRVERSLDAEDRSIRVSGRDKAADLVDCSATNVPGSWRNQTLATIAEEIAAPFGVTLDVSGDTGKPLTRFALQQGETAFAALERIARYRGLILFSLGDGRVRLGNPDSGLRAGRLAEGANLKSIETFHDVSERYSAYIVKGQASGDDRRNGKAVAQVTGGAADAAIERYRPLLVVGEEQSDAASLKQRADWERTTRKARSLGISATVPGWFADGGIVWQPGARTVCDSPSCAVAGEWLIERVRLLRGNEGTTSELTLVPPDAWQQLAEPESAE